MDFTTIILDIRAENDLTLVALAREIGVSAKTVYNWETGKTSPGRLHQRVLERKFPLFFGDRVNKLVS